MVEHKLDEEKQYYEDELVVVGNREDLFKAFYESVTTLDKANAFDTFKQYLVEQAIPSKNVLDMWKTYLIGQGYSGNLSDMEKQFYEDN